MTEIINFKSNQKNRNEVLGEFVKGLSSVITDYFMSHSSEIDKLNLDAAELGEIVGGAIADHFAKTHISAYVFEDDFDERIKFVADIASNLELGVVNYLYSYQEIILNRGDENGD